MSIRCKTNVWADSFHPHRCANKASTPAGYCKVHDPDLKRERAAQKPPGKMERQRIARRRLLAWLEQRLSKDDFKTFQSAESAAFNSWGDPGWPIHDNYPEPKDDEVQP